MNFRISKSTTVNAKTIKTVDSTKLFNDGTTYKLWNVCGCGCGEVVRNMFKQGHDMRVKNR